MEPIILPEQKENMEPIILPEQKKNMEPIIPQCHLDKILNMILITFYNFNKKIPCYTFSDAEKFFNVYLKTIENIYTEYKNAGRNMELFTDQLLIVFWGNGVFKEASLKYQ
jgi:hypothetical protein